MGEPVSRWSWRDRVLIVAAGVWLAASAYLLFAPVSETPSFGPGAGRSIDCGSPLFGRSYSQIDDLEARRTGFIVYREWCDDVRGSRATLGFLVLVGGFVGLLLVAWVVGTVTNLRSGKAAG